CQQYNSEPYTF
nr:immunoglobulin light chain junction region [Macaca mulatta]